MQKQTMMPLLACTVCRQPLARRADEAVCTYCATTYPTTLGILDLRRPDSRLAEADTLIVANMLAAYGRVNAAELLQIRLECAPTYADLIGHEVGYLLNQTGRGQRMADMFQARLKTYVAELGHQAALDIGCGAGGSLLALARHYAQVAGVDISLPDLLVARKVLGEAGIDNAVLIHSDGQTLPFTKSSFDYVNALNVLEHVEQLDPLLAEVRRVLRPGGGFAADSRNRYDLFLPEPHVKVRWVGLLPRRWAPAYVRWRKGTGYSQTWLHSYRELRRSLGRSFGQTARIVFPLAQAYGGPAWVDDWLSRLERMPGLREVALDVFPSHLALAWSAD